ncbi:alpha-ribazole phosphatase [Fodinibius halophilus]|uniref:Alpha-ribazole phosphatase n=1 Tax=Fodinibius halophilus TaxID=1736908 RepID=A0A6M1SSE1_9BACT|nr:alpha-ribazole phosphatase [Fodinibius halophilus]NGP86848.1 alpha-ribazole phosphatase [Fodinibius halophilus]
MDVYLIRHTTPDIDEGICYGQKDIGLAVDYAKEVNILKGKLPKGFHNHTVYSSPLKRCHKLANDLASDDVITDERLMELDFGNWEGRRWDDIPQGELGPWMENFVEIESPGGESYQQLNNRVVDWWQELIKEEPEHLLVATHGGVIRCLISQVLGIPLENSFRLAVDYGSVSKISRQHNRNSVAYINR